MLKCPMKDTYTNKEFELHLGDDILFATLSFEGHLFVKVSYLSLFRKYIKLLLCLTIYILN